jgi:hypothetical protein
MQLRPEQPSSQPVFHDPQQIGAETSPWKRYVSGQTLLTQDNFRTVLD